MLKDLILENVINQKELTIIIKLSSMQKTLWISNRFKYKTMRRNYKINDRKGEDYIAGCLLDYRYIKKHYRLIAVDLSRPKELDAD